MSATLPNNLARVGEDLARATQRDAQRSTKRRRYATTALVLALLALTTATAIANGWLFGSEPALKAAPGLVQGGSDASPAAGEAIEAADELARSEATHRAAQPGSPWPAMGAVDPGATRTLLTDLGESHRELSAIGTTSGGVCVTLTGFDPQCPPDFPAGREILAFIVTSQSGATVIWGIAREEVTAVEVVAADGSITPTRFAHSAFFAELADGGRPVRMVVHLRDGSTHSRAAAPACPLSTPNC